MSANPFESPVSSPQSLSAGAGEIAKRPLDTLPRVLGPFDAMTVVVGGIIGSGIFLKPAYVAGQLHHFGLIIGVWIVMGLITLCGCLALAELAPMTRGQQQAVAIGIVAALSAISILGTHWSAHLQNLTTIIKVGFLLFL